MRAEIEQVAHNYAAACTESFAGHPIARLLRDSAAFAVRKSIEARFPSYVVEGSAGKGRWADVPWIAVFNPAITHSATSGFYVVYLFSVASGEIFLSLNQGATSVREEFKGKAPDVLRDRASIMRARLAQWYGTFNDAAIALNAKSILASDYEAGHVIGKRYSLSKLPEDEQLDRDLVELVGKYERLVYVGGYDASPDEEEERLLRDERPAAVTIEEKRQYRLHRKIERRGSVSDKVKRRHGTSCEACDTSLETVYGELGRGYIEAHHRRPLSNLVPGETASYDIDRDFCVLCANCHRMIHRMADPSDLEGLQAILRNR